MPLENEKITFGHIELEEVTDDEENDKRSSPNNIYIPSTVEKIDDNDKNNAVLEQIATDLVESVLNDVLFLKVDEQIDDKNLGVRELSDDENALRELDVNEINDTDEFIVFPTTAETSDDDDDHNDKNNTTDQQLSSSHRGSLNRLYTFSRTSDDNIVNSRKMSSNQDSLPSEVMIAENKNSNIDTVESIQPLINTDENKNDNNDNSDSALPTYRSHIQKRHINLGRYYDGMMRAGNSQLPTHDLRCNIQLNNAIERTSSDGINEETVRKGRILLDSIPDTDELKTSLEKQTQNESIPTKSILKNTRFVSTDEKKPSTEIIKIEDKGKVSSRKIITTTITEEYRRTQRKVVEEIHEDEIPENSNNLTNREQYNTQQSFISTTSNDDQSPYGLLSECYSGYSTTESDFVTPIKDSLISNFSSLQSTTDEAYESEPTSSSIGIQTYIHPDLIHEFEYPSPPPPIPDRSLKPAHLRSLPPPTKPRFHPQQKRGLFQENQTEEITSSPITVIQHLMSTTSNESTSTSSTRTLSSRHYCGALPITTETSTSTTNSRKIDQITKQNSNTTHSVISPIIDDGDDDQEILSKKSSFNKTKSKKPSSTYFDEATNGLAIRISDSNKNDSTNLERISTKQTDRMKKSRPISENMNKNRSSVYETSV